MAKKAYVGENNVARNVRAVYVGVDGVARTLKRGYVGVNNIARLWWDYKPMGDRDWVLEFTPTHLYTYYVVNPDTRIVPQPDHFYEAFYFWDYEFRNRYIYDIDTEVSDCLMAIPAGSYGSVRWEGTMYYREKYHLDPPLDRDYFNRDNFPNYIEHGGGDNINPTNIQDLLLVIWEEVQRLGTNLTLYGYYQDWGYTYNEEGKNNGNKNDQSIIN